MRAGIVVTGTEVLSGQVADQNGPWVAAHLLTLGVDVAHITVCGDRPADLTAQLRFLASENLSLIVTTGGLGPTADDLTVATVAKFCGLPLEHHPDLDDRITDIVQRWQRRRGGAVDSPALRAGIRKQAMVPAGATPLGPVGTAPGVAVPASAERPAILVLPGPPRELQGMWADAMGSPAIAAAIADRPHLSEHTIRAYGLSEAELAETLRTADSEVSGIAALEVTTCMRRGEIEIVTRFDDSAAPAYSELETLLTTAHGDRIFSTDGGSVDDLVATALTGRTIATAESCTGGLVAARLTDRAGSSDYTMGGVVSYSNAAKSALLDVPAALIAEHGAVSEQVAAAMADGARTRFDTDLAVSTTGVAGPGGGSEAKPVGTVCFAVARRGAATTTVTRFFPGDRAAVRALATTAVMHLIVGALT